MCKQGETWTLATGESTRSWQRPSFVPLAKAASGTLVKGGKAGKKFLQSRPRPLARHLVRAPFDVEDIRNDDHHLQHREALVGVDVAAGERHAAAVARPDVGGRDWRDDRLLLPSQWILSAMTGISLRT